MKKNNGLYLKTNSGKFLLVIPKTLAYNILENIHVHSAHAGVQSILRQIEQEDVWVEAKNKIAAKVCRACILCKLIYRKHEKKSKDQKIRPSFSPYSMAYTDIVEIRSENNAVFNVLSFQDHFSRKVTNRVVRNKESVTVTEALTELITEVGGQGKLTLVSDNGPEFKGKCTEEVLLSLNVRHCYISPTNSRSNIVERFHSELRRILKTTNINARNAKHKINIAVSIYNNKPAEALEFRSPNQVLSNIDPPKYFCLSSPSQPEVEPKYEDHVTDLKEMQGTVAATHLRNFLAVTPSEQDIFEVNDICVLLESTIIGHNKINEGPFIVKRLRQNNNVDVKSLVTGRIYHRNVRYLSKIHLSDEDKKKLVIDDSIVFDPKTFEIGPKELESVKSVLDFTYKNPNKKDNETPEASTNTEPQHRYQLRPRK